MKKVTFEGEGERKLEKAGGVSLGAFSICELLQAGLSKKRSHKTFLLRRKGFGSESLSAYP